jgi:mono/diheme cytochrome c family protein
LKRALVAVALLLALSCDSGDLTPSERGRRAYLANCTACHHVDPSLDGTLGPALVGSSHELIRARVLGGAYPPGYAPKRDSQLMTPLPYLKGDIDDLSAYLAP